MFKESIYDNIKNRIAERDLHRIRDELVALDPPDIAEILSTLSDDERIVVFRILPRTLASDVFSELESAIQEGLLHSLGDSRVAVLLNEMSADDRTAFFEELPATAVRKLLTLLTKEERQVASTLLGYPEQSVGRLMTPDYVMAKENWNIPQVLEHVRKYGSDSDSLNHVFIVDERGNLIDDLRIREILLAPPEQKMADLMNRKFVALEAHQDQEVAVEFFRRYGRSVLPVTDSDGYMLGIVTVDDVLVVAEEEATEDIHKLGAVEALENPYMSTPVLELVRKRANWLIVLFIGEMLTASAMAFFEHEIARAVVLALFLPLIISSGGNSGSQASTLVIRALAIGELTLRDWRKVFARELFSGICLGSILGIIGFLRIAVWSLFTPLYGPHWILLGVTVSLSLLFVVLWGTLTGSMLPFILKRCKLDPATSSAPFVATLVDVTGLVLYFTIASIVLRGALL